VDIYILDLLAIGLLLLLVVLASSWIHRLPLSYALIYLVVGIILSPYGLNLIQLRPDTNFLERLTEFVVLVSLFSCGLKMNRSLRLTAWNSTIRLIGFLMPISIFAIAAIGHWLLNLEWGVGILLGAILAPTDPVLASEVQLEDPTDRDELRFSLTSEGGLNDALAFPFVYFGLHWIEDDNWQSWFGRWVAVDLIWAIGAGFFVGVVVTRGIRWLEERLQQKQVAVDEVMEDFLGLSTILIVYAIAEIVHGYGFVAVFVSGVVLARRSRPTPKLTPEPTPKMMSRLKFMSQLEKLTEVGTILLLGSLLRIEPMLRFAIPALGVAGALFFLIRPIGAWISTMGTPLPFITRWFIGWFGIRGVGSLYYLAYALGKGLQGEVGELIAWITFMVVVASVTIHGMSATPLMTWYERKLKPVPEP
jgi:NhaP-type Na+/H+ or K+/H+ antiporter